MAKKRRKKPLQLAGFRIPMPLLKSALKMANTRVGRVLIAEALVLAAGVLVRKHPVATASALGAEAADATRSMTSSVSETAVNLMQAAADRLRAGAGKATDAVKAGTDSGKKGRSGQNGNVWDDLDQDTIRQALHGEFSRKKKSKKAKAARRH